MGWLNQLWKIVQQMMIVKEVLLMGCHLMIAMLFSMEFFVCYEWKTPTSLYKHVTNLSLIYSYSLFIKKISINAFIYQSMKIFNADKHC